MNCYGSSGDVADMEFLKLQYLQLVDVNSLQLPKCRFVEEDNQKWIFDNMFNPETVRYRPPERYQLRVLKKLIERIQQDIEDPNEEELSDDLMSLFSSLISSKLPSESEAAQRKAYVTYNVLPSSEDSYITLLESRSVISGAGTTGLRTWEAALHLGAYLTSISSPNLIKGKKVLELGAGTGFLSILCAKYLGAAYVTATDGDQGIVQAMDENIFLNELEGKQIIHTGILRWGRTLVSSMFEEEIQERPYDVVIGADITYDKSVIPLLVSTLKELFEACPGLEAIISATIRNEETFEAFISACNRSDFIVEDRDTGFHPLPKPDQMALFYSTDIPFRILNIRGPNGERRDG